MKDPAHRRRRGRAYSFGGWLTHALVRRAGNDGAGVAAEALGVARDAVVDWVLDIRVPDAVQCRGLARFLGVPLAEVRRRASSVH